MRAINEYRLVKGDRDREGDQLPATATLAWPDKLPSGAPVGVCTSPDGLLFAVADALSRCFVACTSAHQKRK